MNQRFFLVIFTLKNVYSKKYWYNHKLEWVKTHRPIILNKFQ